MSYDLSEVSFLNKQMMLISEVLDQISDTCCYVHMPGSLLSTD